MVTFVACGASMAIEPAAGGLRVCKDNGQPEFGVALTSPLPVRETVHRLQVCFDGDCNYFALGVAVRVLRGNALAPCAAVSTTVLALKEAVAQLLNCPSEGERGLAREWESEKHSE